MSLVGSVLITVRSAMKPGAIRPSLAESSKRAAGAVVSAARICGKVIAFERSTCAPRSLLPYSAPRLPRPDHRCPVLAADRLVKFCHGERGAGTGVLHSYRVRSPVSTE